MKDKNATQNLEDLLRVALQHLSMVTRPEEGQAMVRRASRAVWGKPIPIICLVHGRNSKCSCDQPAKKVVSLKIMSGGANEVGISDADLRVVNGTRTS